MQKQTKYTVKAYLNRKFIALMDMLDTDFWSQVEDFVWKQCQDGMNCTIVNNDLGITMYARAEDFTEETIDANELIKEEM